MTIPVDISNLENSLEDRYPAYSEVRSVYLEYYEHKTVITVFLAGKTYDESLMDQLLEQEFEIREALQNLVMEFRYIPLMERDSSDAISPTAKEIFKAA